MTSGQSQAKQLLMRAPPQKLKKLSQNGRESVEVRTTDGGIFSNADATPKIVEQTNSGGVRDSVEVRTTDGGIFSNADAMPKIVEQTNSGGVRDSVEPMVSR